MSFIRLTNFLGQIPRLAARLLPSTNAQVAKNCNLESGELRALKSNLTVDTPTKVGTKLSIYKWSTFWFHWTADVDAVPSPVLGDTILRTYYTGYGVPQYTFSPDATSGGGTDYPNVSFTLGIPAPAAAPTAALVVKTGVITGATAANPVVITDVGHTLSTDNQIDIASIAGMTELNGRTFIVTVLTADTFSLNDEDGTAHTAYTSGGTWTQTYDDTDAVDAVYAYTYVSASGEQGPPSPVSNVVTKGPDQQVNITGMSVGPAGAYDIQDKYIYRDEDTDPDFTGQWAGEVVLALTTFSDTVATADLGEVIPSLYWTAPPTNGAGMLVLPNGVASMFSGKDLYLSEPYRPHAYPAAYRKPLPYDIVATSAIGTDIVCATTGDPYIVTGVDPASAYDRKVEFDGSPSCVSKRSMVDMGNSAMWAAADGIAAVGGGVAAIITRILMDPEDWALLVPSSMHAYRWRGRYVCFYDTGSVQAGFIFDPRQGEEKLVFIDDYATAGHYDKKGGDLYLQIGDDIVKFNGGTTSLDYTWRSKIERQTAQSHTIGKVEANGYPVNFELFADGVSYHTEVVADADEFRMNGDQDGDEWEIEVTGYTPVELVTDTTFSAACGVNWVCGGGWTIAANAATHTTTSSTIDTTPVETLIAGATYTFIIIFSGRTAGTVTPRFGGGTSVLGTARSTDGTYSEDMVAGEGNTLITLQASVTFNGSVSSVSVKRKTDADQTVTAVTVATSVGEMKKALGA